MNKEQKQKELLLSRIVTPYFKTTIIYFSKDCSHCFTVPGAGLDRSEADHLPQNTRG